MALPRCAVQGSDFVATAHAINVHFGEFVKKGGWNNLISDEIETKRKKEKKKERKKESERERERVCVCVCVRVILCGVEY